MLSVWMALRHLVLSQGAVALSFLLRVQVLIHCRAGINRSGTLAIAYVSWKTSTDLLETARRIKGKRYQVRAAGGSDWDLGLIGPDGLSFLHPDSHGVHGSFLALRPAEEGV